MLIQSAVQAKVKTYADRHIFIWVDFGWVSPFNQLPGQLGENKCLETYPWIHLEGE